jgi:hypothetical protein
MKTTVIFKSNGNGAEKDGEFREICYYLPRTFCESFDNFKSGDRPHIGGEQLGRNWGWCDELGEAQKKKSFTAYAIKEEEEKMEEITEEIKAALRFLSGKTCKPAFAREIEIEVE